MQDYNLKQQILDEGLTDGAVKVAQKAVSTVNKVKDGSKNLLDKGKKFVKKDIEQTKEDVKKYSGYNFTKNLLKTVKEGVVINANDILMKLHKVAKDFASKANSEISLENLAIDDKDGTFKGAGTHLIMTKSKNPDNRPDKKDFFEVIKEYVHYFVGPETADKLNENMLMPLKDDGNPESAE